MTRPFMRIIFIGATMLAAGCQTVPTALPIADASLLPDRSRETSGLVCTADGFISINDSGNSPELQQLDAALRLTAVPLALDNIDWEALAANGDRLYIADSGNNSGQRNNGFIHRIHYQPNQAKVEVLPSLTYRFASYPATAPEPYRHDFDAEALAYADRHLWLFSKSWHSGVSQVYQLDPQKTQQQVLTAQAQIAGLPGLVTDAVYLPGTAQFVLTGYQNYQHNLLQFALQGEFNAFVAVTDRQFQLQLVIPLPEAGQLEGICARDGQIWLSQEQSQHSPARLWREPTVEAALAQIARQTLADTNLNEKPFARSSFIVRIQ
ncbi:MAG: hypothetical protein U5L02_16955 [Rheinheimera sp.]|nr:hypothetical protein [Rheinheimera sp.]